MIKRKDLIRQAELNHIYGPEYHVDNIFNMVQRKAIKANGKYGEFENIDEWAHLEASSWREYRFLINTLSFDEYKNNPCVWSRELDWVLINILIASSYLGWIKSFNREQLPDYKYEFLEKYANTHDFRYFRRFFYQYFWKWVSEISKKIGIIIFIFMVCIKKFSETTVFIASIFLGFFCLFCLFRWAVINGEIKKEKKFHCELLRIYNFVSTPNINWEVLKQEMNFSLLKENIVWDPQIYEFIDFKIFVRNKILSDKYKNIFT
jgi:hypothetical protein